MTSIWRRKISPLSIPLTGTPRAEWHYDADTHRAVLPDHA